MLTAKVVAGSLGIFTAVIYGLCVLYGVIVPPRAHMPGMLEMALPGFQWLTVPGFLFGFLDSLLYGVFAGLIFVPIDNLVSRRWGTPATL